MPDLSPDPQTRPGGQWKEPQLNISTTVVIPVHNKAGLTKQCLNDLLAGPECRDAEIIVVDDASTDATAEMLELFHPRVNVITNATNLGFAGACNRGVEAASGELVVLLNNDVRATPGWLHSLIDYAGEHPEAAVIGAKLLFANDTVQHAGVVIGQDANPYHLYAGFPAGHPAVGRSRRFQIVTGACMALRRSIFLTHGGFDTAYVNGHEDVDLCLRLTRSGEGHEVHLCAESVLYHLESASRDPKSAAARDNGRLYRARWAGRVVPDDLNYYVQDGLLTISYQDGYPLRLTASPLLAAVGSSGGIEPLLRERSQQVFELLRESARLSVELGEAALGGRASAIDAGLAALADADPDLDPKRQLEIDEELESTIWQLQRLLAARTGTPVPSPWLEYRSQVHQLKELVCRVTPPGARVAVLSRGDQRLVDLPARTGEHLPQDGSGGYAGFHPADGPAAVASLQALRSRGVGYLAIPPGARWWLEFYPEFASHLDRVGTRLTQDDSGSLVYALSHEAAVSAR